MNKEKPDLIYRVFDFPGQAHALPGPKAYELVFSWFAGKNVDGVVPRYSLFGLDSGDGIKGNPYPELLGKSEADLVKLLGKPQQTRNFGGMPQSLKKRENAVKAWMEEMPAKILYYDNALFAINGNGNILGAARQQPVR